MIGFTLLESKRFPVEKINPLALAEGNAKRPIYQMHKWWARRLSSVFRAILLAAVYEAGEEARFWDEYLYGSRRLQGKTVMDPFMGGGTTLVEALRLGARVVGIDINPVAWFITKKEVEEVDVKALELAFERLRQRIAGKLEELYRTQCPKGHEAEGMYYFWVKELPCPICGHTVELFPNYELARESDHAFYVCPDCHQIVKAPPSVSEVHCPDCQRAFDPRKGHVYRGWMTCPQCGQRTRVVDAIRHLGGPPPLRLYAVEVYCPTCNQRSYKKATPSDLRRWQEVVCLYHREKDTTRLRLPSQRIPTEGRTDPRPVNHGYRFYIDLFNERQRLALAWLLDAILQEPDRNLQEFLLLAFSDCLDSNNLLCKYESAWRKISKMFGLHAFHPIERPTENHVWGTRYGRGTFQRCFAKVLRGKRYAQAPYQRVRMDDGRWKNIPTHGERSDGPVVNTFQDLLRIPSGSLLRCQSATDLSFLPDGQIDLVVTDPPYFDNVQYSELADFFYVWLRLALRERYPFFHPEHVFRTEEIVQNEQRSKDAWTFAQDLSRVFREVYRVLKDDGLFILTFHHRRVEAWAYMGWALLRSGFFMTAAPILRSEGKSGYHSSPGNIRYDAVFVTRKWFRTRNHFPLWKKEEALQHALQDTRQWIERTRRSGMALSEADGLSILYGQALLMYFRTLTSPEEVSVESITAFLEIAAQVFEPDIRQLNP